MDIQNVPHLAADSDTVINYDPIGLIDVQAQNSAVRFPLVLNLYQFQAFGFAQRLSQGPDLFNYFLLIGPSLARVPWRSFLFFMALAFFHRIAKSPSLKTQKRAVARFLMLQVDLLDVQRERLSVHAINHKEKLKFIPQYISSATPNHQLKRKRRT
jgi:hypothetical protein